MFGFIVQHHGASIWVMTCHDRPSSLVQSNRSFSSSRSRAARVARRFAAMMDAAKCQGRVTISGDTYQIDGKEVFWGNPRLVISEIS